MLRESGDLESLVLEGSKIIGVSLDAGQAAKFSLYAELLKEWNRKVNLTAITRLQDIAIKHFLDSLLGVAFLDPGSTIVDVGSGGGVPGIPLAIGLPSCIITLVEATDKKAQFLKHAVRELKLYNVSVVKGRAEDIARMEDYRETFNFAVTRAVGHLSVVSEYCLPLVRPGGYFLAYKGPNAEEELQTAREALAVLGGKEAAVHEAVLPFSSERRTMVLICKNEPTPKKYPRRAGIPLKRPLGKN